MAQMDFKERIILASASPRRREILENMGARFTVITSDADENADISDPVSLTVELARRKGRAVYDLLVSRGEADGAIIISADTVVFCEGYALGKPKDEAQAREMLSLLSGRTHSVATGIAVTVGGKTFTDCSITEVEVAEIPSEEIDRYIASGEPFDKAGGYGIQGGFCRWVKKIDGCYFGVVGLPANLLNSLFYSAVGRYPDEI